MINIQLNGTYNVQRNFDQSTIGKLQCYVYALRDPRDRKVFYIGQGQGNRVFDHFDKAETCIKNNGTPSDKVLRILSIWQSGNDVEFIIIAHGLTKNEALLAEATAIDLAGISQNGKVLNDQKGHNSSLLTEEELALLGAQPVNPQNAYQTVFVFPIHKQLKAGVSPYDATRICWDITDSYKNIPNAYAVGLSNQISQGVYQIQQWNPYADGKDAFVGTDLQNSELLKTSWSKIIEHAKGFWQYGGYLIVSFDGKGQFKIIRGAADKNDQWFPC